MTLYFPDVSAFQAGIDLAGAHAVAIKATQGTGWFSNAYVAQKTNARGHHAFVMAYHFLEGSSPAAQARWCQQGSGSWHGVDKTPTMIDCEPTTGSSPTVGDVIEFTQAFRKLGGVTHLVYFPHWYWQQLGSPSLRPLADHNLRLWSSAYGAYTDRDTGTGWQGYGGMQPVIWQYTDRLHFDGRDIDFNAFRGTHRGDQSKAAVAATVDQLASIASTGHLPEHKAPVPAPKPPVARTATGRESLRHAANREGTTVMRALFLMAHDPDKARAGHFGEIQAKYLLGEDYDAIMPKGMTYWVG
jgi:GH25 family lysozyme M1 (1,4-beta-N-acetylmuramidase)